MAASSLPSPLAHPLRRFRFHLHHLSKKRVSPLFLCSAAKMNGNVYRVPGLGEEEMESVAVKTFERYALPSSSSVKGSGKGVAILWFRNDLRVLDNEALYRAWSSSDTLLPVYCLDPRLFHTTHFFAFPKTGGGPRNVQGEWSQDKKLFESWRDGKTGYPIIDANMKELSTTVRDMGLDWRMGAEWFETCLLDYDPCSNYGNWTYGAGVGYDPREDRYFSIPKQAHNYGPEGEYVAFWVQQLRRLPKEKRHSPGRLMYMDTVVPLKHGHGGKSGGGGVRENHSGRSSRHNGP